jgi:hypothetical protein
LILFREKQIKSNFFRNRYPCTQRNCSNTGNHKNSKFGQIPLRSESKSNFGLNFGSSILRRRLA